MVLHLGWSWSLYHLVGLLATTLSLLDLQHLQQSLVLQLMLQSTSWVCPRPLHCHRRYISTAGACQHGSAGPAPIQYCIRRHSSAVTGGLPAAFDMTSGTTYCCCIGVAVFADNICQQAMGLSPLPGAHAYSYL